MEKRGQIWIETVVYTLIGISVIGLLLAVSVPKLNNSRDKAILKQAEEVLRVINSKIIETYEASPGNSRSLSVAVKKGKYVIDGENEEIDFLFENTELLYSALNQTIDNAGIKITTLKTTNGKYNVLLKINYNFNMTFNGEDTKKILQQSPSAYNLIIDNKGGSIDIRL